MGVLDILRDAMPGVAAARTGHLQGQQDAAERERQEEAARQTALRQAMKDQQDAEWHGIRMQTGRAALEPKTPGLKETGVVNPVDGTIEDVYEDGTRKPVRKATADEIRKATRVPGDGERAPQGTWQPDPNVPGLYVHSGTGQTKRIGGTELTNGNGATHITPPPKVAQRLRDQIMVVGQQIDDNTASVRDARDNAFDEAGDSAVARLQQRGDSLSGVRDSLAAELLGGAKPARGGGAAAGRSAVPMPNTRLEFEESPYTVIDNPSPNQELYTRAADAYRQAIAAGADPGQARARYERALQLIQQTHGAR